MLEKFSFFCTDFSFIQQKFSYRVKKINVQSHLKSQQSKKKEADLIFLGLVIKWKFLRTKWNVNVRKLNGWEEHTWNAIMENHNSTKRKRERESCLVHYHFIMLQKTFNILFFVLLFFSCSWDVMEFNLLYFLRAESEDGNFV